MQKQEILTYLREDDPTQIEALHLRAEETRHRHVGEEVYLRALIEISNHCTNTCHYCGLRAPNFELERYRMEEQEILDCVDLAVELGLRTIVIQAGNDPRLTRSWVANLVSCILNRHDVAIALSLGERSYDDYGAWREAGAQRYLLRFETSDEIFSLHCTVRNEFILIPDYYGFHGCGSSVMKPVAVSWSGFRVRLWKLWPMTF